VQSIYEIPDYISAPLSNGDVIGKIRFKIDGKNLGECDIFIKSDIGKITLLDIYKKIISITFSGEKDNFDE
jgi:hypothetical protein